MWTKTYSKIVEGLSRDAIWHIWTDVSNWGKWHDDLDYCKMEGPFEVGNMFMLKPQGMKPVKIFLTEVNNGYSFTDCTTFFGAKMYDTHSLEETVEGLKLTNTLMVKGPLKWLWIMLVAKNVANGVPTEMEALITLARGLHG